MKDRFNRFFQGRYGMDELGKIIMIFCTIVYILASFAGSPLFATAAMLGLFYEIYRMMSKRHYDRSQENKIYLKYKKLWKLRYDERKTSRIYICKSCGRFIRVPKGKGKIEVTCPTCGQKMIKRT